MKCAALITGSSGMIVKVNRLARISIMVSGALIIMGCNSEESKRDANIAYMRDRLGKIVLEYRMARGEMPETFEAALSVSKSHLPHRGDLYSKATVYEKLDAQAFSITSFGPNGVYEGGEGDDVVVEYRNEQWRVP